MNEAINEERLNDYVDGLLSEQAAAEVERYLASSADARDTVQFLRSLRAQAEELPASIEPERDLWPEVQRHMAPAPLVSVEGAARGATTPSAASWWPPLGAFQWATLAAAAMFLVVTSSAITAWLVAVPGVGDAPTDAAGGGVPTSVALTGMAAIEAEYAVQIERLVWALYENRERLDPDTVSTIETNLRVIDRAIRQAYEAMEEDPENPGLARMLNNNYRHKLQLLQRTTRIIELS
jgi:anti-sigma factor RsiW